MYVFSTTGIVYAAAIEYCILTSTYDYKSTCTVANKHSIKDTPIRYGTFRFFPRFVTVTRS